MERLKPWLRIGIPACILVMLLAATGLRTIRNYQQPGKFDPRRQGYCDFHNGVYFPALAWREGISPYGEQAAARYPVDRQIPLFATHTVALHALLTFLPLRAAEIVYFAIQVALLLACAWLITRSFHSFDIANFLWLAVLMASSRPGHVAIYTGYFTWELTFGVLLALRYAKQNPGWAGIGLMIAAGKPTYALPLGFLLLCRGHLRTVVIGTTLSVLASGASVGWLLYHDVHGSNVSPQASASSQAQRTYREALDNFLNDIRTTQEIHTAEPSERPVNSWTRIDLLALVSKWAAAPRDDNEGIHSHITTAEQPASAPEPSRESTIADPSTAMHLAVMMLVLVPCGIWLWRQRKVRDGSVADPTAAVVMLGMLTSIYHQIGDTMILAAPLAGLCLRGEREWSDWPRTWRMVLIALLLVPLYSYFSAEMILNRLQLDDTGHRVVSSLAGAAILVALAICLFRRNAAPRSA